MSNYTNGILKVRGKNANIKRWLEDNVAVYDKNTDTLLPDGLKIYITEWEDIKMEITNEGYGVFKNCSCLNYVNGQQPAMYSHNGMVLGMYNRRGIVVNDYVVMSKQYHLDFNYHDYDEQSASEISVEIHNGIIIRYQEVNKDWDIPVATTCWFEAEDFDKYETKLESEPKTTVAKTISDWD